MLKIIKKVSTKTGLPPGTLLHVGEKKAEETRITVVDYNDILFEDRELNTVEEALPYTEKPTTTWINIDGLHQVDIIEKAGAYFSLHPLVLEDVLHTGQHPKMEDFDDYLFIVMNLIYYDNSEDDIKTDQFSMVFSPRFLISFQERSGDFFDPVLERLRQGKGRIRKRGTDYLVYALIDIIVDHYFVVLEKIAEKMEVLEDGLMTNPSPEILQEIHYLKRELIFLRKSVWPLREMVRTMERGDSALFQEDTSIYFKDLYDHIYQVVDTTETLREMVTGMLDVYLSSVSNRMNEVMKVLTMIATIFIPITFVAGVYGMNFRYMPELDWHWGYPLLWGIMIAIGIVMLAYFRRKRWL